MSYALAGKRVWVAGHTGLIGSALVERLAREECEIVTVSHAELDLRDQAKTRQWLGDHRPDAVIMAAAKVGGIVANNDAPADFLFDNLAIETNIIEGAHRTGVEKLLFLGSSCVYPRLADQPIAEDALLTGPLEPTNQWYAVAKIAGIKLCQAYRRQHGSDFIAAMPTNLYGPRDNFDLETSHVLPALIRKAHAAKAAGDKELVIWGSGTPLREFLYAPDCADALVFLLKNYSQESHINVGSGQEIAIRDLAVLVAGIVGLDAEIICDNERPDGTPRKALDNSRLEAMGWRPATSLEDGIAETWRWYRDNCA